MTKPTNPNDDRASIERIVAIDEHLSGPEHPAESTAADGETALVSCLELLERVRRAGTVWPGRDEGHHWLYEPSVTPRRIGRFEIKRRIGMGGFGLVFLAHDPQLDRLVALKVPRLETMVSEEARRRFVRESRLTASLAHENIAAVLEAGVVQQIAYMATIYCAGGSIHDWMTDLQRPLAASAAAQLIAALAQAVQHAHGRGVLHRDIKPSNILLDIPLQQRDTLEHHPESLACAARLVDFGLARHETSAVDSVRTRTGAMLGTPAFMAPEQVSGSATEISGAADIYGLGATLFNLLTGTPPFPAATDWETLQAVLHERPAPLPPHVPADLAAICLKCLEKVPADRYRSASELELDLRAFLDGQPVQARPLTSWQRAVRWCHRYPSLATSCGLLAIVFVTATVITSVLWRQAVAANRLATARERTSQAYAEEARTQAESARQAVDKLLTAIAEEPLIRSEGLEPFRAKLLATADDFYRSLRARTSADLEVIRERIETTCRLATIHRLLGDHETAVALWQDAARDARASLPDETGKLSMILGSQAQELDAAGEGPLALDLSNQAVALQEAAYDGEKTWEVQRQLVQVLVNHAQLQMRQNHNTAANESLSQALAIVTNQLGKPPWEPCKLWGILVRDKARALSALGHYAESNRHGTWALEIINGHLAIAPHDLSACTMHQSSVHKTMSHNFQQMAKSEQAEQHLVRACELAQQLVHQHPDVKMLVNYLEELESELALLKAKTSEADGRDTDPKVDPQSPV